MDGLQDDTGDGSMQCTEHPFKNSTPAGGICAFCLQEKLGKLVSSSFPIAVFPSSSSSSPSFRSDTTTNTAVSSAPAPLRLPNAPSLLASSNTQITQTNTSAKCHHHQYYSNRSRVLYLFTHKKKKKKDLNIIIDGGGGGDRNNRNKNLVFKRSKSTVNPRYNDDGVNTPHKHRGFWKFMHSSSTSSTKTLRGISSNNMRASGTGSLSQVPESEINSIIVVEENESPCQTTFDRKVSRSRSVGCGSRSFSGDFFERISTGFGDCTLRRVESHREGKSKVSGMRNGGQDCIKERVKCGGLFSGFMITSSSSSSSSSSYWVNSGSGTGSGSGSGSNPDVTGKVTSAVGGTVAGEQNSRSKSWGWALASPMRALSKPLTSKREGSNKNQTPNLNSIPSLLSVGS